LLGRLVGPSLGKEVDLKLYTRWGLRGSPLGLLPPLGERGGHPHNNRGLPNNSKIKDFYRAIITFFFPVKNYPRYKKNRVFHHQIFMTDNVKKPL